MTFIFQKSEFQAIQATFKQRLSNNAVSAADMILYNILRGRDEARGFTPITNPTKLANGMDPRWGFKVARIQAVWAIKRNKTLFGQILTDEQAASLLAALGA